MPALDSVFRRLTVLLIAPDGPPVLRTAAAELRDTLCPAAEIQTGAADAADGNTLHLVIGAPLPAAAADCARAEGRWGAVRFSADGGATIAVSDANILYFFVTVLAREWRHINTSELATRLFRPAFDVLRPSFDLFLAQWARGADGWTRDGHTRELARLGFTHAEVNALSASLPSEQGPPGEVYPRFYTYCPSLDQYVASALNRGAYAPEYLDANLERLRQNASAAARYGMSSAITCFEPRSVPEALLQKYPMLRGARVDHPLRSFQPRYNLSVAHPAVREHYAELLGALLRAVPGIDTMSVWSNDSGAGFEYTHSLYVGRNGGGTVIREWKDAHDIREAAAANIIRFMRTLRDAGRAVIPGFRTLLRLEPFWEEMDALWPGFEDGIEVEVSSLLSRGWRLTYGHPQHPEAREIHLTALHNHFLPDEAGPIADLRARKSDAQVFFAPGTTNNHEPLTGIPFPRLVAEKLADLRAAGVTGACALGGVTSPELSSHNVNQEVLRAAQAGELDDLDGFLLGLAASWVGEEAAPDLAAIWDLSDRAYRAFPVPMWIYSSWGVWYRMLTRPLVPDIEAIPEEDRRYYEDHLLATAHNRNRIDLRYDVGFDLVDPAHARRCAELMDRDLFPLFDAMTPHFTRLAAMAAGERGVCARDLRDRMAALRCWYRNQRNAALWVAGVHGWLEAGDDGARGECREILRLMVLDEIENTRRLRSLWLVSGRRWMIVSECGESTFLYGSAFGDQLQRKIDLMTGRENDEPRVDPDFIWRIPGFPS